MKTKDASINLSNRQGGNEEKINFLGYMLYPANDNIYSKYKEEKNINPVDMSKLEDSSKNEKHEYAGSKEEEYDYYSLWADDHYNLDGD